MQHITGDLKRTVIIRHIHVKYTVHVVIMHNARSSVCRAGGFRNDIAVDAGLNEGNTGKIDRCILHCVLLTFGSFKLYTGIGSEAGSSVGSLTCHINIACLNGSVSCSSRSKGGVRNGYFIGVYTCVNLELSIT